MILIKKIVSINCDHDTTTWQAARQISKNKYNLVLIRNFAKVRNIQSFPWCWCAQQREACNTKYEHDCSHALWHDDLYLMLARKLNLEEVKCIMQNLRQQCKRKLQQMRGSEMEIITLDKRRANMRIRVSTSVMPILSDFTSVDRSILKQNKSDLAFLSKFIHGAWSRKNIVNENCVGQHLLSNATFLMCPALSFVIVWIVWNVPIWMVVYWLLLSTFRAFTPVTLSISLASKSRSLLSAL